MWESRAEHITVQQGQREQQRDQEFHLPRTGLRRCMKNQFNFVKKETIISLLYSSTGFGWVRVNFLHSSTY